MMVTEEEAAAKLAAHRAWANSLESKMRLAQDGHSHRCPLCETVWKHEDSPRGPVPARLL
jgi:hypothetical protein